MSSKESVPELKTSENEDDNYLESALTEGLAKLNINDISPAVPVVNCCIPEFSCHQSQEEFIFVLKVTDLDKDSIKINFGNKELKASSSCCITCTSNSGTFPDLRRNDYSLFLRFLPECLIQPGKEMVTVSELNAVICLSKHENSWHHWEYFYYGLDADNATYQELLTVSALQHKLDILQKETNRIIDAKQGVPDDEVQISLIDDEIVEFIFEENEKSDQTYVDDSNGHEQSDSNEESCKNTNGYIEESAADSGINGHQPNDYSAAGSIRGPAFRRFRSISECTGEIQLKGILKHVRRHSQTVSESSDDFSWSSQDYPGVDSDIPEEDASDASRTKKSVHFNDNVYRSFFRSNSSILGQREKNRRKQKKKLELRRRRSSEGDSSSGVETDERIDVPQKMACIISVAPLDINQNHSSSDSSGETSNCMERLDNDLPRADCAFEDNIQDISVTANGDRKRRRKKKGNLRDDDYDESNSDNLDNTILVLTSSPESHMYQRHRRYFSRHRQTSI